MVDLHIDELLLDGFAPAERRRVGAALASELERLLTERGVPEALRRGEAIESLDAGAFEVARGARPEAIGKRVALAVYERLCR